MGDPLYDVGFQPQTGPPPFTEIRIVGGGAHYFTFQPQTGASTSFTLSITLILTWIIQGSNPKRAHQPLSPSTQMAFTTRIESSNPKRAHQPLSHRQRIKATRLRGGSNPKRERPTSFTYYHSRLFRAGHPVPTPSGSAALFHPPTACQEQAYIILFQPQAGPLSTFTYSILLWLTDTAMGSNPKRERQTLSPSIPLLATPAQQGFQPQAGAASSFTHYQVSRSSCHVCVPTPNGSPNLFTSGIDGAAHQGALDFQPQVGAASSFALL
jgi:hypothetical protein